MQYTNTYKNAHGKINNMLVKLNSAIHAITPHISDATNGIVNKMGIVSIAVGGTNAIVTEAVTTQDPGWLTVASTTGVLSSIGAIAFIIKIVVSFAVDMYYLRRKDRREQVEHNRRMNDDKSET